MTGANSLIPGYDALVYPLHQLVPEPQIAEGTNPGSCWCRGKGLDHPSSSRSVIFNALSDSERGRINGECCGASERWVAFALTACRGGTRDSGCCILWWFGTCCILPHFACMDLRTMDGLWLSPLSVLWNLGEQTLIPVSYLTHGLSGAGERLEAERGQPGATFSASKMPGENPGFGILLQTEARQAVKMITADRAMAEEAAAASDVDTPAAMLERVGPPPPPPPPPRVSARQRGATPVMRDSYLPRRHLRHDQKTATLPERGSKMPPSEAEIHEAAGLMSDGITPQRRQSPWVTVGRIPIPTFSHFIPKGCL